MLIGLGLSNCDEPPSKFEVESSINRTVNEVERLIRQDSTLPRLTRREIVDILFNITSKDLEAYRNKETVEKARKIYQRALMVVLPYNAENSKENLNDLYTKPPIVQIIADPSNPKNLEAWKSALLQSNVSTRSDKEALENLVVTHASEKTSPKESSHAKTQYKNHKETYSEVRAKVPLKETLKFDSEPIKFSFNLESLQQRPTVTEEPVGTRRPVFQAPSTKDEDVYIVYSTSATTVPIVETSPNDRSKFDIKEPQASLSLKYNQNVLSSNQWRYNAPPSTTTQRATTSLKFSLPEEIRDKQSFSSTVSETPEDATRSATTGKAEDNGNYPSETMQIANNEQAIAPIYVTPVSSSSVASEKSKYGSTYNLNSGGFRRITTTTTTTTTMRPEVMELLASIGLRPENATKVEEVFKESKESLESKFQIPGSNGFLYTTTSGLTAVVPDSPSIVAQNTFENPVSELGKGMNNLTPDVQLLFQRFGLQTSNLATMTVASTPRPTVNTNSYTNFKPLPTSGVKDQDMKEFLAKFGLGVSDHRQRKAMPEPTKQPSLIEAVPDNMRQILENIGLISRKTVVKETPVIQEKRPRETTKFHIFKPHEVRLQNEEQRTKINELLDTVKLVQEGKASVKDVRRAADDLLATTKSLKDGPDPLSLEEIIKVYNEDVKNEVKRQQGPIESIETSTDGVQDFANTSTTPATPSLSTGIKRFMISVLGTSEFLVERIIQGLARIRRMLSRVGDQMKRPPD